MSESQLKLLPLSPDGVPRFDDQAQTVWVPEEDFLEYKDAHDRAVTILRCWIDQREEAEEKLFIIADELDRWEHGCNISTIVGGVAGIGGGSAVIGGVILMPPLAIAGLAVSGVAAASNLGTALLKMRNLKKNVAAAKEMLDRDEVLRKILLSNISTLEKTTESILMKHNIDLSGQIGNPLNNETLISGVGVGMMSVAGGGIRLLLRESASIQSSIAKGAVHAAVAIGIAIDVLTVLLSVKDIMNGSRSEMAGKLRNTARELSTNREEITRSLLSEML